MFDLKYLIIASIQDTKNKHELDEKVKELPGSWDIIYPDGTLITTNNINTDEEICKDCYTRLAYVKTFENSEKDNRTYLQVDSMEVYIKYHILKNPKLFVADSKCFSNMSMGFDINNIVEELGVSKKNIMYTVKL